MVLFYSWTMFNEMIQVFFVVMAGAGYAGEYTM
jgi:hypothetical protein